MATLPQFKQRQIARRSTSDIERLSKQYQQQIAGITGDYEKQFATFSAGVGQKEQVFNEQKKAYEAKFATYADTLAAYNKGMNAYNENINAYLDKEAATQERVLQLPRDKYGHTYFDIGGKRVETTEVQKNTQKYGFEYVVTPYEAGFRGTGKWIVKPINTLEKPVAPTAPEKFTEEQPQLPDIGEFDSSQFVAKKTEAESTLKREIGERRAAKLGAVSRKATRPMLSGAQS